MLIACRLARGAGKSEGYRKLLVEAMHKCAIKFPDVVSSVVHLLMNYLGDDNVSAALDVIYFVREIVVCVFVLCPCLLLDLE
jgi:hypothetical protein